MELGYIKHSDQLNLHFYWKVLALCRHSPALSCPYCSVSFPPIYHPARGGEKVDRQDMMFLVLFRILASSPAPLTDILGFPPRIPVCLFFLGVVMDFPELGPIPRPSTSILIISPITVILFPLLGTGLRGNMWDFPAGWVVKNLPSNTGDAGSIPGRGTKVPHAGVRGRGN